MRLPRLLPAILIAAAFAAIPFAITACEPSPTESRMVPKHRPDCNPTIPTPPADSTCRDGGQLGSGNRLCC